MDDAKPFFAPPSADLTPEPMPQSPGETKSSGMAVASMVLGIVSIPLLVLYIGVITAIVAIVLGHVAASKIKNSQGALTGRGKAIAGFVLGYVALVLTAVLVSIAVPVFNKVVEQAQQTKELNTLKQYGLACNIYAADNDGQFPDSLEELEESQPYLSDIRRVYIDPSTGNPAVLEYLGAGKTNSGRWDEVLLRMVVNEKKGTSIIVYVDGSAEIERKGGR